MQQFPYIITISSEKGGVGKTTLATNLAIFLKAINEELPVSIFSFDNHFTIDKMFSFKEVQPNGSVENLLLETMPGSQLLHTGQYGVNYIPSANDLNNLKPSFKGPMTLARILANSGIGGIVIIDTRPDLDYLTQNALYAADKVLIPVKDMPSLENCRNIFALFDKKGLDKKSLCLIPCLIDERIKFDGVFNDQKTLLRAFAINRGYRCHDVYISKSPKVESLNTNPEGKIYPVLTHGRSTEVHGQFARLANDIINEYFNTSEPRSQLFYKWLTKEDERKKQAFSVRMSRINKNCVFCEKPLLPEITGTAGYYYETSDSQTRGFLDEECFVKMLAESVFKIKDDADDSAFKLLKESARGSYFAFAPIEYNNIQSVEFRWFDKKGVPLTIQEVPFRDHAGGMFYGKKCPIYTLMSETLAGHGGKLRKGFLFVYPVNNNSPTSILQEEEYKSFTKLKNEVGARFIAPNGT
ncbi:MAG: ParA family protein [Desulfuromonadales bacterium]|nr:ParA family protein [Desulfuromonadales bacterium]